MTAMRRFLGVICCLLLTAADLTQLSQLQEKGQFFQLREALQRSGRNDLGYALGTVVVHVPQDGAQEREITFKYATIWRREDDGRWRLVVDISSRSASL